MTQAGKEALRRIKLKDTYTVLLLLDDSHYDEEDEKQGIRRFYLKSFQLDDRKNNEISSLLESQAILKQYLDQLVPEHVTYEEFWSRYFYRCDEARVQFEWDVEEAAMKSRDGTLRAM
jgi:hypothetical protein